MDEIREQAEAIISAQIESLNNATRNSVIDDELRIVLSVFRGFPTRAFSIEQLTAIGSALFSMKLDADAIEAACDYLRKVRVLRRSRGHDGYVELRLR